LADGQKVARWWLWGLGALGLLVEYTEASASEIQRTGKKMNASQRHQVMLRIKEVAKPLADSLHVPMPLLMAILKIESDFFPMAVNRSPRAAARGNAWGLGQVTWNTAIDYANRFPEEGKTLWPKFDRMNRESLWDPMTNLGFVLFYLSRALQMFNGDVIKAGASYHSGKGGIIELVKQRGDQWEKGLGVNGRRYVELLREHIPTFSKDEPTA
jgi:soluble lytic murein transglycosylase-like protein